MGNCYHDYVWHTLYGTENLKLGRPEMCEEVDNTYTSQMEKDKREHSDVFTKKIVKISVDKLYAMWELFHSAVRYFLAHTGH